MYHASGCQWEYELYHNTTVPSDRKIGWHVLVQLHFLLFTSVPIRIVMPRVRFAEIGYLEVLRLRYSSVDLLTAPVALAVPVSAIVSTHALRTLHAAFHSLFSLSIEMTTAASTTAITSRHSACGTEWIICHSIIG